MPDEEYLSEDGELDEKKYLELRTKRPKPKPVKIQPFGSIAVPRVRRAFPELMARDLVN